MLRRYGDLKTCVIPESTAPPIGASSARAVGRRRNASDKQVEDGRPDEEDAADPNALRCGRCVEQQDEYQEIRDEKPVGDGDETFPWKLLDESGERGVYGHHSDEGPREHPRQVFDTACNPHLIADWSNDVVRGQDGEDVQPRPNARP